MPRHKGSLIITAETCSDCKGPLRAGRRPPCTGRLFGIDGPICSICYARRHGLMRDKKAERLAGRVRRCSPARTSRVYDDINGKYAELPVLMLVANLRLTVIDGEFRPTDVHPSVRSKLWVREAQGAFRRLGAVNPAGRDAGRAR